MSYVKMDTIVDQIISVPLDSDGKKEPAGGDFDWDGVKPLIISYRGTSLTRNSPSP